MEVGSSQCTIIVIKLFRFSAQAANCKKRTTECVSKLIQIGPDPRSKTFDGSLPRVWKDLATCLMRVDVAYGNLITWAAL